VDGTPRAVSVGLSGRIRYTVGSIRKFRREPIPLQSQWLRSDIGIATGSGLVDSEALQLLDLAAS